MGSLALGQVLLAHSLILLQNVQHFSLERDALGKVVLEDGKGRCPFDPEYRSTAVMVGKARHPGTLVLPPSPSLCHPGTLSLSAVPWDLCPLPVPPPPCVCPAKLSQGRAVTDPSREQGHAGGTWHVPAGACLWQMASSTPGPSATSRATSRPSPAVRRAASPSRPRTPSTGCKVGAGAGMATQGPFALQCGREGMEWDEVGQQC